MPLIGRNDPCHCGSGKKYKKCHLEKDAEADRKQREKAALNAASVSTAETESAAQASKPQEPAKPSSPPAKAGWMQKVAGKMSFFRQLSQRHSPPRNKGG